MNNLAANQILASVTEPAVIVGRARILSVNVQQNIVILITIEAIPKRPWVIAATELVNLLEQGHVKVVQMHAPQYMLTADDELSAEFKAIRDSRWNRIRPLVTAENSEHIYYPESMGKLVYAHASAIKVPPKTLYRLLYQYWVNGMVPNTLLPNRTNNGAPGRDKIYKEGVIPGNYPKFLGQNLPKTAKPLNDTDKQCIRVGYCLFANGIEKYATQAYLETLIRFYSVKQIGQRDVKTEILPAGEIPTENQFRHWGKKYFDDLAVLRGRAGEMKWLKDLRGLTGSVHQRLYGPGHQFEIDATIGDVYLVSRYNRGWIVGRPVIYVVIDSFSGMIVGIHVGLEGPSWNGARQALFNAFSKKEEYCKHYGVDLEEGQWPCYHLPHEIFADRGELIGKAAEGLATGLKINLGIAPPYRPDWKPIVESSFKVLNDTVNITFVPGAVLERETERGARDYRLDATLDIKEFTKIIINGVLHYNKHNRQPRRLTVEMIAENVSPTPQTIWEWALANNTIDANSQPESLIYLHLLPREDGRIHKGGILFKGMFYTCEAAIESDVFARARNKGVNSIKCWYDPNFTEHIWIQGADKKFISCDLRLSESRYQGFRLEEVEDMLAILSETSPGDKRAKLESQIDLKVSVQKTVKAAKKSKKSTPMPASKAAKLAGIQHNRELERDSLRRESRVPADVIQRKVHARDATNSVTQSEDRRSAEIIDLLGRLGPI